MSCSLISKLWIGGIKKSSQIIAKLHTGCNHCLDAAQVNYTCFSAEF